MNRASAPPATRQASRAVGPFASVCPDEEAHGEGASRGARAGGGRRPDAIAPTRMEEGVRAHGPAPPKGAGEPTTPQSLLPHRWDMRHWCRGGRGAAGARRADVAGARRGRCGGRGELRRGACRGRTRRELVGADAAGAASSVRALVRGGHSGTSSGPMQRARRPPSGRSSRRTRRTQRPLSWRSSELCTAGAAMACPATGVRELLGRTGSGRGRVRPRSKRRLGVYIRNEVLVFHPLSSITTMPRHRNAINRKV
jgi:hypothetical protein